jgi:GNAT superfamily N-acetyltransferase
MLPRQGCSAPSPAIGAPSRAAPEIRALVAAELPAAGKLLATVFDDDPWLRWVYRTAEQRRLLLELNLMSYLLTYTANDSDSFSNVLGAWSGDLLIAVCFFVEPAALANEDRASLFFESIRSASASLPDTQFDAVYQRFLYIERDLFGGPAMNFRGDCYYLFLLGCHPGYMQQGVGTLLVRRLMDLAFSRGFGVYLDTFNDDFHDHRAFYSRFGFVPYIRSVLPGQDKFPDSEGERAAEQPISCVVDDTLIAWPTLQSRIDNHRAAAATPLPVAHTDSAAITSIGELRCSVWRAEGDFRCQSPCWTDEYDTLPTCYHWVILGCESVVACARLTFHARADDHRDIKIFTDFGERSGRPLRFPVADLGRLVVAAPFRCRGYAQQLNRVRIQAAKDLGCASVVVTASASNAKMLKSLGFIQLMQHDESPVTVVFDDRPSTMFYAMCYAFT